MCPLTWHINLKPFVDALEGFGPGFSSQTMMNENDAGLIATATPDILVYNPTRELTLAETSRVCIDGALARWPEHPRHCRGSGYPHTTRHRHAVV